MYEDVFSMAYLDLAKMEEALECDDFDEPIIDLLRFPMRKMLLLLLLLLVLVYGCCRHKERP